MSHNLIKNARPLYEQSDIIAATGVKAGTLQAWQSRGIVRATGGSTGTGVRRLFTAADAMRIALLQHMIAFKIPAAEASAMCGPILRQTGDRYLDTDWDWSRLHDPLESVTIRSLLLIYQQSNDSEYGPKAGTFAHELAGVISDNWARFGQAIQESGAVQWHIIDLQALAAKTLAKLEDARARRQKK